MARAAIERYPGMPAFRWALAAVLCESGRDDAARAELERLSAASLAELPRDALFLTIATLAAEVCAHLGDDDRARDLYALLAPHAPRNAAAIWGALCLGSVERCLGLLTGAMGRTDEAANHFEAAISFDARLGSPPLVARTRIDYARSLLARGRPGDRVRATQLLEAALQIGQRLELSATSERASRLLAEMGDAPGADIREAAAQADAGPPPVGKGASSAGDASAGPRSSANFFRREGDYWTVCFDGQVCRIRDSKGARYLARLLSHPGHEFHALELLAEMAPVELAPVRTRAWPPGRAELEGEALSSREPADAGDILDAKAKESYRRRLRDLEDDLEEARANGDLERASSAEEELEFLGHELARALGLSGRERKSSSPSERARLNVSRALRTTVEKLARFDPALGEHLAHSIRTGRLCSYSHDPALEIAWET
jgi:tetratricopeptide (TPR) repeat protein